MKLLASIAPHTKFSWVAVGLLGALAASLALRQRTQLRSALRPTGLPTTPAEPARSPIVLSQPSTEDDRLLKEEVENALNRVLSVKGSILVEANDGEVTLRGQALATDLQDVIGAACRVPGLRTLHNRLEIHDIAEIAPEFARPRQAHRESEIPTSPTSLDSFDEDSSFETKT